MFRDTGRDVPPLKSSSEMAIFSQFTEEYLVREAGAIKNTFKDTFKNHL
jgi:hypothetical protein